MKKLSALLLAILLVLSLITGVSAQSDKILMGTPVVDGVLDEIYKQSVAVQLGEPFHTTGDSLDTDATATAYLLYDADNLYVCVVVNDDDILLREKEYIESGDNPWENELVEIWVDEEMLGDKTKISLDPEATRIFGSPDPLGLVGETKGAATKGDKSYTVEFAIPLMEKGTEGKTYGFSLQVNDLFPDGHVVAIGSQAPEEYTFGGPVVLPEPEPEPEPEEPAEQPEADVIASPPAPATFDSLSLAAPALAAAASFGAFAMKKRRP